MTKDEILEQLKHDRDLCNFNPSTGESEPIDEDCRKSAEALDYAIKAIKIVEEFERAQIITGGRLNGRTYAYKCGLEDGKRKALEQNTVSEETYTQEHFARKEAEQKLWVLQQNVSDDCVSRQAVTDAVNNTIAKYIPTFIGQYEKIPLELSRAIRDVSPVVPTLKVGKWIYNKNTQNWECSECGETPKTLGYVGTAAFMTEHFKFCNHCGAEMRGVEK